MGHVCVNKPHVYKLRKDSKYSYTLLYICARGRVVLGTINEGKNGLYLPFFVLFLGVLFYAVKWRFVHTFKRSVRKF